ncbi:conserved protein of unknown function [Candidatus Promineifilum breve]|uniref:Putative restriction endonuclease domain-containing protein n=1 Tax=Candidatus Promineifilum breve TaxID=1806508 RepID=A0A161KAQ6_9CHLR|nr:Uma2 family endonuclease [Candidatus Promineifilum breve]CUS03983.2 conserved protein of unknown function [Candidatus Promineifilum breve]
MTRAVHVEGEPVWELARLFPTQGNWSETEYLALNTNHFVELSRGCLIFPPMPDLRHQSILGHLLTVLYDYCKEHGGNVLPAPLPLKLAPGEYREPDLLYLSVEQRAAIVGDYPDRAALVMEIVMGEAEDRDRVYINKRRDYAQAGIPEYWIVDPQEEVIFVLRLEGKEYVEHGRFIAGDTATSSLLPGFTVPVADVWAAAN